jgi:hypothetical protein
MGNSDIRIRLDLLRVVEPCRAGAPFGIACRVFESVGYRGTEVPHPSFSFGSILPEPLRLLIQTDGPRVAL